MNKFKNLLIFTTGAAIGSFFTWKLLKTKYEQIAQEEIDSVKEMLLNREAEEDCEYEDIYEEENDIDDIKRKAEAAKNKPDVSEYSAMLNDLKYSTEEAAEDEKKEENNVLSDKPYVISPDDFGEFDDYDMISLTYYEDLILADEGEIVENVEEVVGFESLNHFGDFEPDSVHVRNDRLKADYEIVRVEQKFYED